MELAEALGVQLEMQPRGISAFTRLSSAPSIPWDAPDPVCCQCQSKRNGSAPVMGELSGIQLQQHDSASYSKSMNLPCIDKPLPLK